MNIEDFEVLDPGTVLLEVITRASSALTEPELMRRSGLNAIETRKGIDELKRDDKVEPIVQTIYAGEEILRRLAYRTPEPETAPKLKPKRASKPARVHV